MEICTFENQIYLEYLEDTDKSTRMTSDFRRFISSREYVSLAKSLKLNRLAYKNVWWMNVYRNTWIFLIYKLKTWELLQMGSYFYK